MAPWGEARHGLAIYSDGVSDDQINPDRIDDDTQPTRAVDGTTEGNPIAGAEIDDEAHAEAVEPDDNAFEVDGPQAGHA